jgi:hypothetical protein
MDVINLMDAGKETQRTAVRRQFPIATAYGFTDYRARGQTIRHVVVDIASPPSGKVELVNLYVALSRSSRRDPVRLLRNFDAAILQEGMLEEEDKGLEGWDEVTKECQWMKMTL